MVRVVSGASFLINWGFVWVWPCTSSICGRISSICYMELYLSRMCRCASHTVLWSHIGILMHLLAAEPHSTAGLLFPFKYLCGTIFVTPYSKEWHWRDSRAWPLYFIGLTACSHLTLTFFPFSSFILNVFIVGLGSSDWKGVNRSLPALHWQPILIILLIIIIRSTATDRRWAMTHSNTPPCRKRSPLTTRS